MKHAWLTKHNALPLVKFHWNNATMDQLTEQANWWLGYFTEAIEQEITRSSDFHMFLQSQVTHYEEKLASILASKDNGFDLTCYAEDIRSYFERGLEAEFQKLPQAEQNAIDDFLNPPKPELTLVPLDQY